MNDETNIHDLLEAYVLRALDRKSHAQFERHLLTCAVCQREYSSYSGVLSSLQAIEMPPAPPLPRATDRRRIPQRSWSRQILIWGGLAGASVAVLLGVLIPRYDRLRTEETAFAQIARMLATDPVEVALIGPSGVSGRAIVGEAHRFSGFVVSGLPPAAPGLVYRVWLRGASLRRSPGTLERVSDRLYVLVTPGNVLENTSLIRVMLESASTDAAGQIPRRMMLEGTVG